ncbi:MAG: carbohydrate kinase, partial [Anaerolineae bacterium]|nr:carbohydrate kinase [Anaerolineae bacterium]
YLNCLVLAQPVFEPHGVGVMFCLPNRTWLRSMINVSGTTSLDWCIDQLFAEEKNNARSTGELFAHLEALAQQSRLGARGVLYLPYLSAQGITAPLHEPAARAEFSGLTLEHTRSDLLRAVYEGLALSIRDGYACIPAQIDDIWLTGGTSRSAFFCQMVADCTGKQVVLPAGSEFGAKGAALLASVGSGWHASLEEACAAVTTIAHTYDPDPVLRPAYDALFADYTALREALVPVWRARQRTE